MGHVFIRCHAELNDFLPKNQRSRVIVVFCVGHETIKNVIESIGVPHPELAALYVNGKSADFGYHVQSGDHIEAYPASVHLATALAPRPPLRCFRFILDSHLGRLAAYLRMMGFDTLYRNDYDDAELAQCAHDEQRILLTRDVGLLKRSLVIYGAFVREITPHRQLSEIIKRFDLYHHITTHNRCIRCNGLIQPVAKADIEHRLKPKTRLYYDVFYQCRQCWQIYWQGSHYLRIQQLIERILQEDGKSRSKRHGDQEVDVTTNIPPNAPL